MGTAFPFNDDLPFEEKVKCFEDQELLEIWEESQEMESMLAQNLSPDMLNSAYFEQAIIHELTIRLGRRIASSHRKDNRI